MCVGNIVAKNARKAFTLLVPKGSRKLDDVKKLLQRKLNKDCKIFELATFIKIEQSAIKRTLRILV